MTPVIILGAGGHTRVLIDAIRLMGISIAGLTDAEEDKVGSLLLGLPILGGDEIIVIYGNQSVRLVNGLGSVNVSVHRQRIFEQYKKLGYEFANVIHPSAIVATEVELGEGVQIMAGVILQTGCRVGENVILNTHATVDHDCILGRHVHIAPGATLSGGVQVGDGTHIGTGATVVQGVRIGAKCLIAAGAVVTDDVADRLVVAGVPAKEMRQPA